MAQPWTPNGVAMECPNIEGRALLNASPLSFVHELIKSNPKMPIDLLTVENVELMLNRVLASKQLHFSPFFDVRTHHVEMLRQWHSSPEWEIMQSFFKRKIDGAFPPSPAPNTQGVTPSNTSVVETMQICLPSLFDERFAIAGLDLEAFIEAFKASNPTLLKALSVELVKAAVEYYALKKYHTAAAGAIGVFKAHLNAPQNVRAFNEHSSWLTKICQPKPTPNTVTEMPTTDAVGSKGISVPTVPPERASNLRQLKPTSNVVTQIPTTRATGSQGISVKQIAPPKEASKGFFEGIPEISFMDDRQRAIVLSRGSSSHISLPPDDDYNLRSSPKRSHLHCLGNPDQIQIISQKLRIIPLYNRAVVVEFDTPKQRDAAIHYKPQKFCFGPKIMTSHVKRFEDDASTRGTKWVLRRANKYTAYSLHEALRRFFCLEGHVPVDIIYHEPFTPPTQAKIQADKGLPNWLWKILTESRVVTQGTTFEVHIPSKCQLCNPTSSALAVKRKAASEPEFHGENPPFKKPKLGYPPPSNVTIKTELVGDETEEFLESMKRELEVLQRRRALLIKAQADINSTAQQSSNS